MSTTEKYDVLVIGSRVAGASLGLLLGKHGRRVLLVDRDHFPSDTLSTHIVPPQGVSFLNELGVLADVEAVGFRRIVRTRTYVSDCLFEGPIAPSGGYALAPRRSSLDSILIEHATKQQDVEFRPETRVVALIWEDSRVVGAVLSTADREQYSVRARIVVGADGRYSQVAKWVAAPVYDQVPDLRPIYYGYFSRVTAWPEPALEVFYVGDWIAFLFPMQPDLDCLVMEVRPQDFETFRRDSRVIFEESFRKLPFMADRLKNAKLEGSIQGTRGVPNLFRKPYGPGWVLTGDAAHSKDPSTGFGIRDALLQSFLLSEVLNAILNGAEWETSLGEFEQKRNRALLPSFRTTVEYMRLQGAPDTQLAWLRAILANPHLCRAFMQSLSSSLAATLPEQLQADAYRMAKFFNATQL